MESVQEKQWNTQYIVFHYSCLNRMFGGGGGGGGVVRKYSCKCSLNE